MTDEETIKELKERIDGLEANVDELVTICERLTDELARFTITVEKRFRSQNAN
ncbi:hypothetical protein LCGC14_1341600, partial [marine sediment metagenome]